jgi:hypothetical protein
VADFKMLDKLVGEEQATSESVATQTGP